jgi:hypothetical protein
MIRKEEWRKGRVEIKQLREEILKQGRNNNNNNNNNIFNCKWAVARWQWL